MILYYKLDGYATDKILVCRSKLMLDKASYKYHGRNATLGYRSSGECIPGTNVWIRDSSLTRLTS